jgi:galactitol-specific phosphotransferase system IIC component
MICAPFWNSCFSISTITYTHWFTIIIIIIIIIINYALQPLRLTVRSGLDVPIFATRRLHFRHHARAASGGGWNFGREMSGNFA